MLSSRCPSQPPFSHPLAAASPQPMLLTPGSWAEPLLLHPSRPSGSRSQSPTSIAPACCSSTPQPCLGSASPCWTCRFQPGRYVLCAMKCPEWTPGKAGGLTSHRHSAWPRCPCILTSPFYLHKTIFPICQVSLFGEAACRSQGQEVALIAASMSCTIR